MFVVFYEITLNKAYVLLEKNSLIKLSNINSAVVNDKT